MDKEKFIEVIGARQHPKVHFFHPGGFQSSAREGRNFGASK